MLSLNTVQIMIAVSMAVLWGGDAFELEVDRATTTSACIRFRSDSTQQWGYLKPSRVTQQTAAYLCRSFLPGSVSGIVPLYSSTCYVTAPQYDTTLNCPFDATSDSNCTVSGSGSQSVVTFYAASIQCIVNPTWSTSSSLVVSGSAIQPVGEYGTSTGRGVMVSSSLTLKYIRPHPNFAGGTICVPNGTSSLNNSVAQAMCRTAGLEGSLNSTVVVGSASAANYPAYLSNLQCSDGTDGTLWNGGCTYNESYYDTPTACSENLPVVSCPASFDMRLGEPTKALYGYQLVELRPEGTNAYNGIMCVSSPVANYANVMCHEMYGDDTDFAGYLSVSISTDSDILKEYVTSVTCSSSSFTSLSQCTASVTPVANQAPCSYGRGIVTCKVNKWNTVFSLSSGTLGKGYLLATVPAAGETEGSVCSDGFNQDAALAACRSVGYTPGSQAGFTVASSTTDRAINNVTCTPGADTLSDCKLRYSGAGNKLSYADVGVCSGRVYLDCDVGTLAVEFRMTSSRYLQARLSATSEWGWVDVISGVSGQEGYDTMCSKSTSSTGDSTITKSYLSISSCPTGATSYTECTVVYTNGKKDSRDYYCSPSYSSSSRSTTEEALLVLPMVLFICVPAIIVLIVLICVYCKYRKAKAAEDAAVAGIEDVAAASTNNAMTIEMSVNHFPAAPANNSPVYGRSEGGAFSGQGGLFQETPGTPPSPTQGLYYNHPGGMYGEPVLGTPYQPQQGGVFGGPPAPYPMGVAANHPPPFPSTSCDGAPSSCGPTPYGRGSYD